MSRKPKPFLEGVRMESVAAEGNSLAHVDGKVLFVSQTMPGDLVDVQVNKVRKGYMEGYVVRMVEPSPDRIPPFCSNTQLQNHREWRVQKLPRLTQPSLDKVASYEVPPASP